MGKTRLCPKHCLEAVGHEAWPAGHDEWTNDLAMLEVKQRGKGIPILESGEEVQDWPARRDACDALAAAKVGGQLLFSRAAVDDASAPVKHPAAKEEGDGRERLFANGYMLAMLAAVVSFVTAHKRKPKGAELHPWLDFAWSRYVSSEADSAAAAAPAPGEEGAQTPGAAAGAAEADPSADAAPGSPEALAGVYGDQISSAKTNIKPLADWQPTTNLNWITSTAQKASGGYSHALITC